MKLTKSKLKEIIRDVISEQKRVQLKIPIIDKLKVDKILKGKLKLKVGKDFDYGVGPGATFILDLDRKTYNRVLDMLIANRIRVSG